MWGTKRHGLESAGMIFVPHSEALEEPTTASVMFWYQCQCGQTYSTLLTFGSVSDDELENLVSGLMNAAQAVFGRITDRPPSQPSSSDLSLSLTRAAQRLSENGPSEAKNA